MQVLSTRCCGLDVHQQSVVACRLITSPTGRVDKQVRTFSTMTTGLCELARWLQEEQVIPLCIQKRHSRG